MGREFFVCYYSEESCNLYAIIGKSILERTYIYLLSNLPTLYIQHFKRKYVCMYVSTRTMQVNVVCNSFCLYFLFIYIFMNVKNKMVSN